jgi:hypothetical protein
MTDAMRMVGIEGNLAKSGAFQGRMKRMLIARTGESPFKYDDDSKIERTVAIYKLAMRDKSGLKKLSMADAMRFAGCTDQESYGNSALRAKIDRAKNKIEKEAKKIQSTQIAKKETEERAYATLGSKSEHGQLGFIAGISALPQGSGNVAEVNGSGTFNAYTPIAAVDVAYQESQSETFDVESPLSCSVESETAPSQQSGKTNRSVPTKPPLKPFPKAGSSGASISSSTTSKNHRKTSREAHDARKDELEHRGIRKSAYKTGTTLYASVSNGENTLQRFSSAEKCAAEVNRMFGYEILSGYQLQQAVKNDRVGLSPPKRGSPSRLPDDEMHLLANLVFTCETIEQVNCVAERMERGQTISILAKIVNERLESVGEEPVNEQSLYRRIEFLNSRKQVRPEKQCFSMLIYTQIT